MMPFANSKSHLMSQVMPAFVFARKRQIEIETGLTLAGLLVVDLPKGKKLKQRDEQLIVKISNMLTAERKSGLPDDAIIYGWHGGVRPPNADEIIHNDELMSAWAKTRITIEVRIDPHADGRFRFGPTDLRALGVLRRDGTKAMTKVPVPNLAQKIIELTQSVEKHEDVISALTLAIVFRLSQVWPDDRESFAEKVKKDVLTWVSDAVAITNDGSEDAAGAS